MHHHQWSLLLRASLLSMPYLWGLESKPNLLWHTGTNVGNQIIGPFKRSAGPPGVNQDWSNICGRRCGQKIKFRDHAGHHRTAVGPLLIVKPTDGLAIDIECLILHHAPSAALCGHICEVTIFAGSTFFPSSTPWY